MDFSLVFVVVLMVSVIFLMRGRVVGSEKARSMLKEARCQVVDVRTAGEFDAFSIPGTTHLPLKEIKTRASQKLPDKGAPILVFCQSGMRSGVGVKILRQMGYRKVANLGSIQRAGKFLSSN